MLSDLRSRLLPMAPIDADDSPALTVNIASEGAHCVAYVRGELDIATRNIVFQACLAGDQASMVIDMAQVDFMDCGGYGGIVAAGLVLQERGCSLTLRNQTGQPARLLGLLSLSDPGVEPADEIPISGLEAEGSAQLVQSDTHAPNDDRYWLTEGSNHPTVPAPATRDDGGQALLRAVEPFARNDSTRHVCTIRHRAGRADMGA